MTEKIRAYLRGEKGFTLVEMMVVLIIIAVLIAGGIRFYLGYIDRSKITKATGDLSTMAAALDSYYASQPNNGYPESTDNNAITAAGLTTANVNAGASAANVPYVYKVNGTSYELYTADKINNQYVIATGDSGKSGSAYTSIGLPW